MEKSPRKKKKTVLEDGSVVKPGTLLVWAQASEPSEENDVMTVIEDHGALMTVDVDYGMSQRMVYKNTVRLKE